MADLTEKELEELASLEAEEEERKRAKASDAKRQHLEALRLRKTLAARHGEHGLDYVVLETVVGNIAVRRPVDVEIDTIDETSERPELEKLARAVVLAPDANTFAEMIASHPGVMGAVISAASSLLKVTREAATKEAAKK